MMMNLRRILLSILGAASLALPASAQSHFAWGAEAGGSIDVSGNDMSSFDINAFFGYKNRFLDIAGVGAGINMMVSNSCRTFPFYAIVRTGFRSTPSLCFLDLRTGCALNNMSDNTSQTTFYISPGLGFNLAISSKFKSYFSVAYTYNGMSSYGSEHGVTEINHGDHLVSARFGVTF